VAEPVQVQAASFDIVLADDHEMVRAGLRMLLDAAPEMRVVAEAGDAESAVAVALEHRPRVVILDLNMPGGGTIPAIGRILEALPGSAVVVLTMQEGAAYVRAALAAGASAYILKEAAGTELVEAVRAAACGKTYLNPRLGAQLAAEPASATGDELRPGSTFAGHRIDALAGRGGMAVVYRATDLALDRPVALKLVARSPGRDEVFRARFERECRLAAAIDHPHVVPVYRAGEEQGRLYLTMRFVEGTDLRSLLEREGRLSAERAVAIAAHVAGGLDEAHRHGLVHRDVKPANILVERRRGAEHGFLTDFGVSMERTHAAQLTAAGFAVGTAEYMAPEQARGAEVDGRADVYALACVLFRALTGRVPYDRTNEIETLWAHVNDPPPRLRDVAPELPRALDDVLVRALEKDPAERTASAGELARDALAALRRG
jgi:DNA-binding NarL/FixJ family response regulator